MTSTIHVARIQEKPLCQKLYLMALGCLTGLTRCDIIEDIMWAIFAVGVMRQRYLQKKADEKQMTGAQILIIRCCFLFQTCFAWICFQWNFFSNNKTQPKLDVNWKQFWKGAICVMKKVAWGNQRIISSRNSSSSLIWSRWLFWARTFLGKIRSCQSLLRMPTRETANNPGISPKIEVATQLKLSLHNRLITI